MSLVTAPPTTTLDLCSYPPSDRQVPVITVVDGDHFPGVAPEVPLEVVSGEGIVGLQGSATTRRELGAADGMENGEQSAGPCDARELVESAAGPGR
jgi:hypothetical protein